MASTLPPRPRANNNASHAPLTRTAEDQELLRQLDACVDRMRTHIPDEPYILTIPQDEPKYHHYSRSSADAWLKDTPFDRGEDYQMQYQTFFYREPNSDTFERVRASHFDRPMSQLPSTSTPRSNTATPSLGPTKKISLAMYNKNKKDQSALSTPLDSRPQSQPHHTTGPTVTTLSKPQSQIKTDKAQSHTKTEKPQPQPKTETPPANNRVPESTAAPTSSVLKRKSVHESSRADTQDSLKRPRLSPQPQPKPRPSSQSQQPRPRNDARMPRNFPNARLSPLATLSPNGRLSPLTTAYLPGRISPTLPPEFVAALDERHHKRTQSNGSTASADSNAQPKLDPARPGSKHDSILSHTNEPTSDDAVPDLSQKKAVSDPSNNNTSGPSSKAAISNSAEKDAISESSRKDTASKPSGKEIASELPPKDTLPASSSKDAGTITQSDDKPTSLVVVLKIPKRLRIAARRLLQFPPQPCKDPKSDASTTSSPETTHSNETTAKKTTKPSAEKRVPKMEEEPVKGVARKISVSSKSNQDKAHLPTPKPVLVPKNPSSAKRLRQEDDPSHSTEPLVKRKKSVPTLTVNNDPTTPVQPDFRSPALPHSVVKSQQATPTPRKDVLSSSAMKRTESTDSIANNTTPTISNRTPASSGQATAGVERPRHNSSNPRPSPSSSLNKTPLSKAWTAEFSRLSTLARELKHSTATSAEATALTWLESFLAFVLAFYCLDTSFTCNSEAPPSPENWKSCGGFYGAVVHSCQKFPHLHGLALYLGAVYNGVIMRRISSASSKHNDPNTLHSATFAALRAADEAAQKLPLSAIMGNYRNTWSRGMSVASEREERLPTPRHYEGGFSLNVGVNTDPLEAVRFAHSVMTEWCDGSDVDHKMRLKLES